jgi:hypothetical protein
MRPLLAHCHRDLAGLKGPERAQAEHHAITATTLYREMRMTCWIESVGPGRKEES